MNKHVTDQIVDLLEGRLAADKAAEIHHHLTNCADCAADASLARKLHQEALEQALRHLSPERIVDLASSTGEPLFQMEDRHLSRCSHCAAELEWSREQPDAESILREERRSARPTVPTPPRFMRFSWKSPWTWMGASAAAAIVILLFFIAGEGPHRSDPLQLARLARLEPLPVQITRSPAGPGSFEEARLLGLEAYAAGNYEQSVEHLQRAADLSPDDDEVLVYLGSAWLLSGNSDRVLAPLERIVSRTQDRGIQAEALWLLANSQLLEGNAAAAVAALQRIETLGGRHEAEARTLRISVQKTEPSSR